MLAMNSQIAQSSVYGRGMVASGGKEKRQRRSTRQSRSRAAGANPHRATLWDRAAASSVDRNRRLRMDGGTFHIRACRSHDVGQYDHFNSGRWQIYDLCRARWRGETWAVCERALRRRMVSKMESRIKELELSIDPNRTTSGLTIHGKTNPNDE